MSRPSLRVCFVVLALSLFSFEGVAQDADACPRGWEAVSKDFLRLRLDSEWEQAATYILPKERTTWVNWQTWSETKLNATMSTFSKEVQDRHQVEVKRDRSRLDVSNFLCEQKENGDLRVRVDPDGRSYQFLTLCKEGSNLYVSTRMRELDLESVQAVKAYMEASDARRWEEAQAWVAQEARPRFAGYRAEVEMFLSSNEALANARNEQAELRVQEWSKGQMRVEQLSEDMLEVHMEFPTATTFACELVRVEDTWRVLLR